MNDNFVGNTLTQSKAIETYTFTYDVTSSRPRKTKIAFFANFGGIEKLFCAPEQSLNSKIMNQCNVDFNFLEQKRGLKFHFIGTLKTYIEAHVFHATYQALVFPSGKSSTVASNVFSTRSQPGTLHANLCKPENIWRGFVVTNS